MVPVLGMMNTTNSLGKGMKCIHIASDYCLFHFHIKCLPNDSLSVIKKKYYILSDAFSTILDHLLILYAFICITHLLSSKKAIMSGHSVYSREGKNLVNLFDLFSRHSVGLKIKEKKSNSSRGIWMDMFGMLRKLGSQFHYSFSSRIPDTFAAFGYENLDWCNMIPRNLSHSSEHTLKLIEANRKVFCVLRSLQSEWKIK